MGKQEYITEEEKVKCRKIMEVYKELYEESDLLVLDAGRYGFVKLQYYRESDGFENVKTYTESRILFEDLWDEWFFTCLLKSVEGTPMQEREYGEIYASLPVERQREIMEMRSYFADKAKVSIE